MCFVARGVKHPSQDPRMVSFYPVNSNGHKKSTMSALINFTKKDSRITEILLLFIIHCINISVILQ
jgi:hypothetical protein